MGDIQYLACGNIMSDSIKDKDGNRSEWNMGGPAFYALSGMRIWTKDCKLVCRAGADYKDSYGKWMDSNGVSRESVIEDMEHCTRLTLSYMPNGSYGVEPVDREHLGYLKTHSEDIDKACEGHDIKGMYMAHNLDKVIWDRIADVKKKHGFKIMWEIEYGWNFDEYGDDRGVLLDRVRYILPLVDAWSINSNEASDLFEIPKMDDDAIIKELQKLPTDFTFYRVGERGSFAVTKDNAWFVPALKLKDEEADPTGCGNSSTGAAAYALFSGNNPAMVACMANVASGYNALQRGPYMLYTGEVMQRAKEFANELYVKQGF